MNNLLKIKTPAQAQAAALQSEFGLANHGLSNLNTAYWNLPAESLYEEIAFRGEGRIAGQGPVIVETAPHTSRSAADKFLVREPGSEQHVWWGEYNRPFASEKFDELFSRLQGFLQGRDLFVQDCYAGADPDYRLQIRIVTEYAWHSLFARDMFLRPETAEQFRRYVPDFTVICVPSFKAFPSIDGTRAETFIGMSFDKGLGLIGGTAYAGEIKKTIFTLLNYQLPLQGVLPMHCSANVGEGGDVALFFGLSGTGKTSLSADPVRHLIGDDEHGWSDSGVFNFEAGCYAKVIRLSPTAEPQIYAATRRFGTVLENVVFDPVTRRIDLDNDQITENTRASYPLEFIENALSEKLAGHPKNVVLLTCDASGVMPPIARLSPQQALYQFISGYTAKVAGTEAGAREEPEITFSTCFGAPFMVHHPAVYADLLRRKLERHGATPWLINTGWVGGAYGVGKRISIGYTRAMLSAALSGALDGVEYVQDPVFGFQVPKSCPGVPAEVLDPASAWPSRKVYLDKYRQLAGRFIDNFRKFADEAPADVSAAGPKVSGSR
jgi:phosphoenolpyruvate carboxykinase (ATP)